MDLVALRVERIRTGLQAADRLVELQARRHTGVLVVGLTFLGTAIIAGLTGQLPPSYAVSVASMSAAVVLHQMRGLARLAEEWRRVTNNAITAIEDLIREEEASNVHEAAKPDRP